MSEKARHSVLKLLNEELDRRIGGISLPSLIVIEGPNDSGKSVLSYQIIYGALSMGLKVCLISSEGGGRIVVKNMESLSFEAMKHYLTGRLHVVSFYVKNTRWRPEYSKLVMERLVAYINSKCDRFDLLVVDSLTVFVTGGDQEDVLTFLSRLRMISEKSGVSMVFTVHPYALTQETLIRIRSLADAHFLLSIKEVGDKIFKTMQILKIRGASKSSSQTISFDVDPAFGIKILPYTQVKV
jgi:flagellar protein FlaH